MDLPMQITPMLAVNVIIFWQFDISCVDKLFAVRDF
jgi:hypothetical protein